VLSFDELGRELEFGVRQLQAKPARRFADGGTALQSAELAQHYDVIGIVPLKVRLQVANAPQAEVIFQHLAGLPRHQFLLGSMTPLRLLSRISRRRFRPWRHDCLP
jgi:hypothetical protein